MGLFGFGKKKEKKDKWEFHQPTPEAIEAIKKRNAEAAKKEQHRHYVYDHEKLCIIKSGKAPDLSRIKIGDKLKLAQEPTNKYDSNAIRVLSPDGKQLGYMYKGKLQTMANDFLSRGDRVEVTVDSVTKTSLTFKLDFYK